MKDNLKNGLFLLLVYCVVIVIGVMVYRDFLPGEAPVIVVKKAELQASFKGPFYYSGKARISGAMDDNAIQDSAKLDPVYTGNANIGGGRNDDAGPGPKSDLDPEMYAYTGYDVPAESDSRSFDEDPVPNLFEE